MFILISIRLGHRCLLTIAVDAAGSHDVDLFSQRLEGLCHLADLVVAGSVKVDEKVIVPLCSLAWAPVSLRTRNGYQRNGGE